VLIAPVLIAPVLIAPVLIAMAGRTPATAKRPHMARTMK
jgi:hypothetical protein